MSTPPTGPAGRSGPIRVLVVDDSLVIRRLVTEALDADPQVEVIGVAQNGKIALRKIAELKPDAVTMDIEMPEMDGISCVKEVRKTNPRLPIVMFSTLTERGASSTLDALAAGASDYVTKPSNVGSVGESKQSIREQLIPKLVALTTAQRPQLRPSAAARLAPPPARTATARTAPAAGPVRPRDPALRDVPFEILAVGSSTGGPDALAKLLAGLAGDLPVPVVLVQHMPPIFTRLLAERLNSNSPLTIVEAEDGMALRPGTVLVAPGGRHLEIDGRAGGVVAKLTDAPPENYCRPAVDVLFRSVARVYAHRTLGVILTGMGRDGTQGSTKIREAGGQVFAQDEASSVVWGMPGALVAAGQADRVVPLLEMPGVVSTALARARSGPARAEATS
jgi:two-component system, chemotaxis family, protein-glutamate methylesterase/glutaminase